MSDFDPTKNLLQYVFLNECEKNALRNWPWGWEFYSFRQGRWSSLDKAAWIEDCVYRGKPKPVVVSRYCNIEPQHGEYTSRHFADLVASPERIAVLRIDTCNGVSTAHLE